MILWLPLCKNNDYKQYVQIEQLNPKNSKKMESGL